jgi:Sulfotransferase family
MANSLFFVHVPRCGGTSLMHHFELPRKVRQNRSLWGQLGMAIFFSRYQTLESRNFPVITWGNAVAAALLVPGVFMIARSAKWIWPLLGALLCAFAVLLFVLLTFVFTAPVIARCPPIHRAYLIFVHYVLCRFMESIPWCTGTNITGYMMHLTAHKLLSYNYVSTQEMETAHSMAIVRNPYARMVSIYSYNRFFGEWESFEHFLNDWYRNVTKAYRQRGELEEWHTPCHAIPQFEYTHWNGKQIVHSVIKQEELKYLHKEQQDSGSDESSAPTSVTDLPDVVRDALCNMPHTNQRSLKKAWYEYYNQRTLDLVYEIYHKDFEVFGYSPTLAERPDLEPPSLFEGLLKSRKEQKSDIGKLDGTLDIEQDGEVSSASVAVPPSKRDGRRKFPSTGSTAATSTTSTGSGGYTTSTLATAQKDFAGEPLGVFVLADSLAVSSDGSLGDDDLEMGQDAGSSLPPSGASSLSD